MKILLWDIDGTLIRTGNAGHRAMNAAALAVFGLRDAFAIDRIGQFGPHLGLGLVRDSADGDGAGLYGPQEGRIVAIDIVEKADDPGAEQGTILRPGGFVGGMP